ncbi:MAG: histidine phosphatase family protein [Actinomycetota bacterium]
MDLILIRHGEPDIHADDLTDPPLTPLGERQAEATAAFLADAIIDAIYVSPQLRAQQTVTPLAARHGLDPVTDKRIAEWDYEHGTYVPSWANDPMNREEAMAKFNEMQGPEFHARVRAGFDDIITDNPSRSVAVVCHGGVIRSLVQEILNTEGTSLGANHASITRVAANRRGTRSLISFNEHHWIPTS